MFEGVEGAAGGKADMQDDVGFWGAGSDDGGNEVGDGVVGDADGFVVDDYADWRGMGSCCGE